MAEIDTGSSAMESEKDVLAVADGEKKQGSNGYLRIFSYADSLSWTLNGVALICIIATGTLLPLMNLIFGKFITVFTRYGVGELSPDEFRSEINKWALYFIYLFVAKFVLMYVWTTFLSISAMRTTAAVRTRFVESTLRQDIAFFDQAKSGSVATQVATNGNLIQQGVSEKLGVILQGVATVFASFVIAFVANWKLTLICIAIVPVIIIITGVGFDGLTRKESSIFPIYSRAGLLAEEVLSSMRTVHAFWAHPKLTADYAGYLQQARQKGLSMSIWFAVLFCAEYFCIFAGYGLAFWQGIRMYASGEITEPGDIVTVIFAVILAATSITSTVPQVLIITKSVSAAEELFQTIDRPSAIDPLDGTGECPTTCTGYLELSCVDFTYPSRPDAKVLNSLSIQIPAGKTTALVGASGSGKSTIIGILERWYLPTGGKVTLDGNDISDLNVPWLRTQMRLVQQEPVLFSGTIFQNIANGLIGTPQVDASDEEKMRLVEEACRAAYAHDFIVELTDGYHTQIGERAAMLSGGQKQRIAIARSIISNPKILLLDEATSALDPKAERIVQQALDNVSTGRTTLVIAHKLSTIQNADNIIVMSNGSVVEQGTHHELIAAGGAYFRLVQAQDLGHRANTDDDSSEEVNFANTQEDRLDRVITTKSAVSAMSCAGVEEKQSAGLGLVVLLWKICMENKSMYWHFIVILITTILGGLTFPALAVLFARAMDAFQLTGSKMVEEGDFWSLMFLVVAIANLILYLIMGWLSNFVGQHLTYGFRVEMFENMLKQDMEFFDKSSNSTGALVSKLSTKPTQLQELLSFNICFIMITIVNVFSTAILAIAVGWKLGLVVVFGSLLPLVLSGWLRMRLEVKLDEAIDARSSESAALAAEAISSMRTVSSLTLENHFLDRYKTGLKDIEQTSIKSIVWTMIWYSLSQSIAFLCMGLGFWYGGKLLASGEYSTTQFFTVYIGVVLSGESAAAFFLFTSSITKGHSAANYIMWLRSLTPKVREFDASSINTDDSEKRPTGGSNVACTNLHFAYPQRPKRKILRGIDAEIQPGQFIAFVGASGCGKTTMIALLERFYDPISGTLSVDGHDITTVCPRKYRRDIALVQQEPTLYQGSIRENIAMGLESGADAATDEQIDEACRQANIFTFVSSLPEGLNTMCGARGSQLSGGQKQRIAIARALIRNPRLLLLDEATSALDTESERIVQEALEKASEGRTTIAVAHRLSTIKHADKIFVFEKGNVVEMGTHEELVAKRGIYFEMCQGQSLDQQV